MSITVQRRATLHHFVLLHNNYYYYESKQVMQSQKSQDFVFFELNCKTPRMISLLLKNSITYWWNSMTFQDHSHFP